MVMLNGDTGFITPIEVFDAAWGHPAKSLPTGASRFERGGNNQRLKYDKLLL
jgi:hypothetical protein